MPLVTRPIPRPLLAALVLPLVVIVGFQSAWAAFACRVDGKVRDRCCCEKKQAKRAPDEAPRLMAQSCCDVTIHEANEAPLVRQPDPASFEHVPVVVPTVIVAISSPRAARIASIAMMARPPPPRVPLFLDKHAILR